MTNHWDAILANDAAIFTDPVLMPGVESIVYSGADGNERTINAQVFRGVVVEDETGTSLQTRIVVNRKDVPLVRTSADRVTLALRPGEAPEQVGVMQIINQDAGAYELRVE